MATAPEKLFCTILEKKYEAIVSAIEAGLVIPKFALLALRSNFTRLNRVLYGSIETAADLIAEEVISVLKLDEVDQSQSRLQFCAIAFACEPLIDELFNTSLLDPFMSEAEKAAAQSNYEDFERLICKLGLSSLITSWTDDRLTDLKASLIELRNKLLDDLGLNQLISDYMTALQNSGILDLLNDLDDFANCGFEICNFVSTSSNKQEDIAAKLSIEKQGGSWAFVIDENMQEVFTLDGKIRAKIDDSENKIDEWLNNQRRTDPEGVPPDQTVGDD